MANYFFIGNNSNKLYYFIETSYNKSEAQNQCQSGKIFEPQTKQENDEVVQEAARITKRSTFWIGALVISENVLKYDSDGSNVIFVSEVTTGDLDDTAWCVFARLTLKWIDYPCSSGQHALICEWTL